MKIDLRNSDRQRLFSVTVDAKSPPGIVKPPEGDSGPHVSLNWDEAIDDEGHLRRCPACGCRELFVRKDFPQVTGFVIIAFACVVSIVLFGWRHEGAALAVLGVVAVIDGLIFFFTGKCVVCYRCRSEFRKLPIPPHHATFERSIDEKYRKA